MAALPANAPEEEPVGAADAVAGCEMTEPAMNEDAAVEERTR
jgi:hypothetical protein